MNKHTLLKTTPAIAEGLYNTNSNIHTLCELCRHVASPDDVLPLIEGLTYSTLLLHTGFMHTGFMHTLWYRLCEYEQAVKTAKKGAETITLPWEKDGTMVFCIRP